MKKINFGLVSLLALMVPFIFALSASDIIPSTIGFSGEVPQPLFGVLFIIDVVVLVISALISVFTEKGSRRVMGVISVILFLIALALALMVALLAH